MVKESFWLDSFLKRKCFNANSCSICLLHLMCSDQTSVERIIYAKHPLDHVFFAVYKPVSPAGPVMCLCGSDISICSWGPTQLTMFERCPMLRDLGSRPWLHPTPPQLTPSPAGEAKRPVRTMPRQWLNSPGQIYSPSCPAPAHIVSQDLAWKLWRTGDKTGLQAIHPVWMPPLD